MDIILSGNVGDILLFVKRLKFLFLPLADLLKNLDINKILESVFGKVANIVFLNKQEFISIALAILSLIFLSKTLF